MMEQSKSLNLVTQYSTSNTILPDEYKYQLKPFPNSIGERFIGFIQRKFTQKHQEEKHDFDDLSKIE